jgi:hypothetical protein
MHMTLRFPALIVALWLLAGVSPARAQSQHGPGGSATQPPASTAQEPRTAKPQQDAATPKPEQKPHKVITNDDIEGKGEAMYPTSTGGIDLSHINDCDRFCFEQVR